ncbi:DNA polymerase III subunit epsilon [Rhodobacteraceae bacterium]|nr:DNA polymerase III subunit epsilon [Paracoccaceae bacterium]
MRIGALGLRMRVFLLFVALAAALLGALGAGLFWGAMRAQEGADGYLIAAIASGFVGLGVVTAFWWLFDEHIAKPLVRFAAVLRISDQSDTLPEDLGQHLGDLRPAVCAVLAELSRTRTDLTQTVAAATVRMGQEKQRLEALLSDVPVGVLLVSADHHLVFYNAHAVDLLGAINRAGLTHAASLIHGPGLDRSIFDYLSPGPILHGYERLEKMEDPEAATDILCTTVQGENRVLAARMRRLSAQDGAGYVLTLRDISSDRDRDRQRADLMDETFARLRPPVAALQSLIEVLSVQDGPVGPARDTVRHAAHCEITTLSQNLQQLAQRHEANRRDWAPMTMIRASDLADVFRAARARAGQVVLPVAAGLMLRCDAHEIVALLSGLAARLPAHGSLRLEVAEEGTGALVALEWEGPPVDVGDLERWLAQPLEGLGDLRGREVLDRHATDIWPERLEPDQTGQPRGRLCLPLLRARRVTVRPEPAPRGVVYDFDLLDRPAPPSLDQTPLKALSYVVFDTETTGLSSQNGDEIVQISAVRIVNGRRLEAEVFDTLVNPGRPIPASSTAIHGITHAMVQDAPDGATAIAQFHRFAQDAVLVAHNAPFDMGFLQRHEASTGVVFDHPILDTVLLSAIVFGQNERHTLDALCQRLAITIPEEARHTALGDAVATAEAFLKLLPALEARGQGHFGAVVAQARRHGRLLRDMNGARTPG